MYRHLRIRLKQALFLALLSAAIASCGHGSGGPGETVLSTRATVVLPPGFTLPANSLHVTTMMGSAKVASNGTFNAQTSGAGPQLVAALNAASKLVMLGFVEPGVAGGVNEISARQTAVALLYTGLGGSACSPEQYPEIVSLINANPALTALTSVIAARLAVNPTALADGDSQITVALQTARQAILPAENFAQTVSSRAVRQSTLLAKAPAITATTVSVSRDARSRDAAPLVLVSPNPSDQLSGVQVGQDPNGPGIVVTNNFRRHCKFFIYKTADVDLNGSTITSDPPAQFGAVFDLPATQRLSGVISTLIDIANGKVFWSPINANSVVLPLDTNMSKTIYTVVVVGPSFSTDVAAIFTDPRFVSQTSVWQDQINSLTFDTFFADFLLPTLLAIMVPQATISDVLGDDRLVQFNIDAVVLITQFVPEVAKEVGELTQPATDKSALSVSIVSGFVGALADVPEFRAAMLKALFSLPSVSFYLNKALEDGPEIIKAIGEANEFLEALDLAMRAGDAGAILHDLFASRSAESWEVDIIKPTVHLNPSTAVVSSSNSIVSLSVTLPGIPDLTPYRFSWTTSASMGVLQSLTTPTPLPAGPIPDSSVDYVADPLKIVSGGSDTVTVQVFNSFDLKNAIGQAISTITASTSGCGTGSPGTPITSVCGSVNVNSTVRVGNHLVVGVVVHTGGACGGGATLSLQDISVQSVSLDGAPQATTSVGIGNGSHTVDYLIAPDSDICSGTQVLNSDPNLFIPMIFGPWVLLQEGSGGNNSGWTSQVPITVTH